MPKKKKKILTSEEEIERRLASSETFEGKKCCPNSECGYSGIMIKQPNKPVRIFGWCVLCLAIWKIFSYIFILQTFSIWVIFWSTFLYLSITEGIYEYSHKCPNCNHTWNPKDNLKKK